MKLEKESKLLHIIEEDNGIYRATVYIKMTKKEYESFGKNKFKKAKLTVEFEEKCYKVGDE